MSGHATGRRAGYQAVDQKLRAALSDGLTRLGLALDAGQIDALLDYLALLAHWNRKFNLTAIREPAAMVAGHLLDSLAVAPYLRGPSVIDVGTGAGLPGLPLAIACPSMEFVLLDSNGKKTRFVHEALRVTGVGNASCVQGRVEGYRPDAGFDTVVCRAFAPLPRLIALAGHLTGPGGIILALKGRFPDDEIAAVAPGWTTEAASLSVPGLADRERQVITLRRSANDTGQAAGTKT